MRYFLFLLCFLLGFMECRANAADSIEYPDQFQIRQDRALRMFHILKDKQFIGVVVNSDWGVLDFYNSRKEKEYLNHEDSLYDNHGSCVGFIQFASYKEWISRSSRIEIYSNKGELLVTVEAEGDERSFIFRDAETQEPMAIALWRKTRSSSLTSNRSHYSLQDWSVTVTNRLKLQEKKIPFVFLVWALLKHSQKFFPSPQDCKHEVDFERDDRHQGATTSDQLFEISSIQLPEKFHVQQDSSLRLFCIIANEKLLNVVVNSKSGKFDFYDNRKRRQGGARVDSFYENSGHCLGFVELKSDTQWLPPKSTHIKILSDDDVLLATLESEDDEKFFVFRDAETCEALAIARWNYIPTKNTYFSWLVHGVQDWSVTILDPIRLQEKEIPTVLLVWALLKHSEKHLPWSWICEYLDGPPPD